MALLSLFAFELFITQSFRWVGGAFLAEHALEWCFSFHILHIELSLMDGCLNTILCENR